MTAWTKETFFFDKASKGGFDRYESLLSPECDTRLRADVAPQLFHKA